MGISFRIISIALFMVFTVTREASLVTAGYELDEQINGWYSKQHALVIGIDSYRLILLRMLQTMQRQ